MIGSRSDVFGVRIVLRGVVHAGRYLDVADVFGDDAEVAHQLVDGTGSAGPTVSVADW